MFVGDCCCLDATIVAACSASLLCFCWCLLRLSFFIVLIFFFNALYLPLHVHLVCEKTHTDLQSVRVFFKKNRNKEKYLYLF